MPTICLHETNPPELPTTSTNNMAGTWNPATVIVNSTGEHSYIFTPENGTCGKKKTVKITVKNPDIEPTFDEMPTICLHETNPPELPTTSTNNMSSDSNRKLNRRAFIYFYARKRNVRKKENC